MYKHWELDESHSFTLLTTLSLAYILRQHIIWIVSVEFTRRKDRLYVNIKIVLSIVSQIKRSDVANEFWTKDENIDASQYVGQKDVKLRPINGILHSIIVIMS